MAEGRGEREASEEGGEIGDNGHEGQIGRMDGWMHTDVA